MNESTCQNGSKKLFFDTKRVIRKQTSSVWIFLQARIKFTNWSLENVYFALVGKQNII